MRLQSLTTLEIQATAAAGKLLFPVQLRVLLLQVRHQIRAFHPTLVVAMGTLGQAGIAELPHVLTDVPLPLEGMLFRHLLSWRHAGVIGLVATVLRTMVLEVPFGDVDASVGFVAFQALILQRLDAVNADCHGCCWRAIVGAVALGAVCACRWI